MLEKVYGIPEGLKDVRNTFCAGCSHPMVQKLICEVLQEEHLMDKAVICLDVSCGINARSYFDLDFMQTLHGRGSSVAAGAARCNPDNLYIAYQGDGGALSIGLADTFYAANRGDRMVCLVLNNQIYGMTGGQQAPTTLIGQKSTTGVRTVANNGYPVKFAEIVAGLEAPGYVARGALNTPKAIKQSKEYIRRAFKNTMDAGKYSYVELLCMCPTNWNMTPAAAVKAVDENVIPVFPVGEFKK